MKAIISGFISLKSILESKSREVYEILLDEERYNKVITSKFHAAENRQYNQILKSGIPIKFLQKEEFESLNVGNTSGGIAAYVGERSFEDLHELLAKDYTYYTVLDGIEDPYNFGYALRSLYAAGVDVLILPQRNFYSATEIIVRASAGASELIHSCVVDDIVDACIAMKEKGIHLIATANSREAKDMNRVRVKAPTCILYGGEKRGISSSVLELCDETVKIKYPRNCHYSLPAVCAVSIISFEMGNQIKKGRG